LKLRRQITYRNKFARADDSDRALDDMFQFLFISWPRICHERTHGLVAESVDESIVLRRRDLEEVRKLRPCLRRDTS
jgi:hypothetical protein